mmetsp:Transcript_131317/g.366066  ORF Transcript_131317/g.366066 Transcript_131317/m.366066 type:complete len:238 (+) Transcript_131317:264-977(+)
MAEAMPDSLDEARAGLDLAKTGREHGDSHGRLRSVPRIDDVCRSRRAVVRQVHLVTWQHTRGDGSRTEVRGEVDEVQALQGPCVGPGRQASSPHLAAHDGNRLCNDVAPWVGIGPEAHHLLDLEEAVVVHLADQPKELEDCLALQLPATAQVHLVFGQPLHTEGIDYELALSHVDRKEVDVANAEARLLSDLTRRPLLVCLHGVVRPGVEVDELVHRLHDLHEPGVVQRVQASVRHP